MKINQKFWLGISLFNLLIVAALGTLMRYKIGFEFPYFNQKHIQHAHSHFAFTGWITHTLFVLMIGVIQQDLTSFKSSVYRRLVIANLVCAYGMLISFMAQGYGTISITFSTFSIFTAYLYSYYFFKDLKTVGDRPYRNWFTAALWFNIISSLGTFTLAFLMASHNFNEKVQLGSLYYYLHFQYNGFFMFACMGLFMARVHELLPSYMHNNSIFLMLFLSCIPAYFLSVLWIKLPVWLYVLVVLSALIQVTAWARFLSKIRQSMNLKTEIFKSGRYLFLIIALAISAKFLLQLGSTVPAISKLAFGFRPIIIAYLHLILLAIISVFLVSYMYVFELITVNKMAMIALIVFVTGVYFNEIILGVQGIASFSYTAIPFVNEMLFMAAVIILMGLVFLLFSQRQKAVR